MQNKKKKFVKTRLKTKKAATGGRVSRQIKLSSLESEHSDISPPSLLGAAEALIFASGEPIAASKIAAILEISQKQAVVLIEELMHSWEQVEHGVMIVEVAGGYQMVTKPVYAEKVSKIVEKRDAGLSLPALETLAIIAFKQPITRLEIENIRGVKVDGIVNMLSERLLIKEVGRKDVLGRPILYGTTDEFLLCFGIKNLDELPPLTSLLSERGSEE